MATDGHRLAQAELPLPKGATGMPGIILPRKTVHELHRLIEGSEATVQVGISPSKARFEIGTITLTTKLIDGTFPDYARVIPKGNDKALKVDNAEFKSAVDRVSTIASERGRAVKLNISSDKLILSVNNPEGGSATEETRRRLRCHAPGNRLQRPLSPGHRRSARERDRALPACRSGLPDHGEGRQRRRRALRADADACLTRARHTVASSSMPLNAVPRADGTVSSSPELAEPRVWVERLRLTNFRNYTSAGSLASAPSPSCSPVPTARARPTCSKPSRC